MIQHKTLQQQQSCAERLGLASPDALRAWVLERLQAGADGPTIAAEASIPVHQFYWWLRGWGIEIERRTVVVDR